MVIIEPGNMSDEQAIEKIAEERSKMSLDSATHGVTVLGGAISAPVAAAIRLFMEDVRCVKPWIIYLDSCYPLDDEAACHLRKAFAHKLISHVTIVGDDFDPNHEGMNAMLKTALQSDYVGSFPYSLEYLSLEILTIDDEAISAIQTALRNSGAVYEFRIFDCRFLPRNEEDDPFESLFEGLPRKPTKMLLHFVDFGEQKPLTNVAEWQGLRELSLGNASRYFPNFLGLPKLTYLNFGIDGRNHSRDMDGCNLVELLQSEECQLKSLKMSTSTPHSYKERVVRSMQTNSSVTSLIMDEVDVESLVEVLLDGVLSANKILREIKWGGHVREPQARERLAAILQNENSSLEIFNPCPDGLFRYLARNWAGRRILSCPYESVPMALWPIILARVCQSNMKKLVDEMDPQSIPSSIDTKADICCADSMYHLLRNCDIGMLFSLASNENLDTSTVGKKRKRYKLASIGSHGRSIARKKQRRN